MDESSTGSVEDLYSGLCTGPALKADRVHCVTSQEDESTLALTATRGHRARCATQLNQENPLSDQDDDALVIDAQVLHTLLVNNPAFDFHCRSRTLHTS